MKDWLQKFSLLIILVTLLSALKDNALATTLLSPETQACLECHIQLHPGITEGWRKSAHSQISLAQAMKKKTLERKVSIETRPNHLAKYAVGCAECHTANQEKHKDTFDHNGYRVHVVVTPNDCAICHPLEAEEYGQNLMSHAHGNIKNNPLYHDLAYSVNGLQSFERMEIIISAPDPETEADSCFYCHGTAVKVKGMHSRETDFGQMTFPILSGWPNHGVGRLNPDESKGSCTPCHARHHFSIVMARKPHTCSECHKGPDVPAYAVYQVSKHGNIYYSLGEEWNFKSVPWTVGKDFTAPTCAVCHASLIITEAGNVIAKRTHRMNDRLPWRIMGLIYAHPHPRDPNTSIIKNQTGLPLPTELTGEVVAEYLIDDKEQEKRSSVLKDICMSCHSYDWVNQHFVRFEKTIQTTNKMTLAATKIMFKAWDKEVAKGLEDSNSIFNEAIEKRWVQQWLFFANSTRFASAMAGADYGVFANGRWYLSRNIQDMKDWLEFKLKGEKVAGE